MSLFGTGLHNIRICLLFAGHSSCISAGEIFLSGIPCFLLIWMLYEQFAVMETNWGIAYPAIPQLKINDLVTVSYLVNLLV
jgi:hypothetical protein